MSPTLQINDITFVGIKTSIKNYLRAQTQFQDYNFEGSSLATLIDVLAYNTYYQAFYGNMIMSESYLDSAQIRENIVSRAKHLAYVPRSIRSSRATVTVTGTGTLTAYESLFTATIDGANYNFVPTEEVTLSGTAQAIELVEGTPFTFTYVMDTSVVNPRFEIPNDNVDATTVRVSVRSSLNSTDETAYELAGNITEVSSTDKVFWLQENYQGRTEVYFGDNTVGVQPGHTSIIRIDYLVSNGTTTNEASIFSGPSGTVVASVITAATGGADKEDNETIRLRSPKSYAAQNRAVTVDDFESVLLAQYPNIESIAIWGGEDQNPPQYGKVYISIKPEAGYIYSTSQKDDIVTFLKTKGVVSITPKLVDPDYTYLIVNSKVSYDPKKLTVSSSTLATNVKTAIYNYSDINLDKFNTGLKYSKLIEEIDNTNVAITGNVTTLQLKKLLSSDGTTLMSWEIDFGNEIAPGELSSSAFDYVSPLDGNVYECFLQDNGTGLIQVVTSEPGTLTIVNEAAGIVDYVNGIVDFYPFVTSGSSTISLYVLPGNNGASDVYPKQNQILTTLNSDITVNLEIERV